MTDNPLKPIADLSETIRKLIAPFSDPVLKELGEYLAGRIRYINFKRSLKVIEEAKCLLDEQGIKPKAVSLKILVPLLENAGLEDNDDLISLWSGLLASSASAEDILPSFVNILSEIGSHEAKILNYIFMNRKQQNVIPSSGVVDKEELLRAFDLNHDEYGIRILNLLRLGLIEEVTTDGMMWKPGYGNWSAGGTVGLSALGEALIKACSGPQKYLSSNPPLQPTGSAGG